MIVIALSFLLIMIYEWNYLQRHRRKPRTFVLVMGWALLMCVCIELLYHFHDRFQFARVIEFVFDPLEKVIVWRYKNG